MTLAGAPARADIPLRPDVPDKRVTSAAPEARFAERPRFGLAVAVGASLNHTAGRTSLHLGTSTILFDLYGVPAGTTGLYVGVSLLGLEWRASRAISVIFDPADVAYPLPQLRGAPFGYLQYRFTLGLQWGA